MTRVVPLNPELNSLVEKTFDEGPWGYNRGRPGGTFCAALRLCRNDAETNYVLNSLEEKILVRLKDSTASIAWDFLNELFASINFPEISGHKTIEPKSEQVSGDSRTDSVSIDKAKDEVLHELRSGIEEQVKERTRRCDYRNASDLKHVGIGFDELYEGISKILDYDFQHEFDGHLARLVPLFASKQAGRAPVLSKQTMDALRSLMCDSLDELEAHLVRERDSLVERLRGAGLIESEGTTGDEDRVLATALVHFARIRSANLLAFELLYPFDDSWNRQDFWHVSKAELELVLVLCDEVTVKKEGEALAERPPDVLKALRPFEFEIEATRGDLIDKVQMSALELIHSQTAHGPAYALAATKYLLTQSPFLIPGLRRRLVRLFTEFASQHLTNPGPFQDIGTYARTLLASAVSCDLPNDAKIEDPIYEFCKPEAMLMEALEFRSRPYSLSDLVEDVEEFCVIVDEVNGLEFTDGSRLDDDCGWLHELREHLFDRVRDAPKSDEKMAISQLSPMYDATDRFFFLLDPIDQFQDKDFYPAIFLLCVAFFENEDYGDNRYAEAYVRAFDGLVKEGFLRTASHVLCHLLITFRIPAAGVESTRFSVTTADAFKFSQDVRRCVVQLAGNTPIRPVAMALEVARQIHLVHNGITEDDQDFFSELLKDLSALLEENWLASSSAHQDAPEVAGLEFYRPRLQEASGGMCDEWPISVYSDIARIESERDFNVGNKSHSSGKVADDYPWVISYSKIIESKICSSFNFVLEPPYVELLKKANPDVKKFRRPEPFSILKLLRAANNNDSEYMIFARELNARGIELSQAKKFLSDYYEQCAPIRNTQAHGHGPLHEAEVFRRWVLRNLSRLLKAFPEQP